MSYTETRLLRVQIERMPNVLSSLTEHIYQLIDNAFHTRSNGDCLPSCWCQIAERMNALFEGTEVAEVKEKWELERLTHDARESVLVCALSLTSSRIYSDLHPEYAEGGWDVELREELLWDAVKDYYLSKIVSDVAA